jgi:hypothetical protein
MAVAKDLTNGQLAEFGGLGTSFNICRGMLGSLARFTVADAKWLMHAVPFTEMAPDRFKTYRLPKRAAYCEQLCYLNHLVD